MKVTLNKKTSTKIFNRAPINFWEPPKVEKDSTTKTSCKDHICHEVKYDPSDKEKTLMWSFVAMESGVL